MKKDCFIMLLSTSALHSFGQNSDKPNANAGKAIIVHSTEVNAAGEVGKGRVSPVFAYILTS